MNHSMRPAARLTVLVALLAVGGYAQEPTFMEAATHPGAGQLYGRLILSSFQYRVASGEVNEFAGLLKLSYGVRPDLAVLIDGDVRRVRAESDTDTGLGSATLRLKYRFFKRDYSALNTWRASVQGGVGLPGNYAGVSPDHVFVRLGVVSTAILGRHGLNGQVDWTGYAHGADVFSLRGSYLYRISPAVYGPDTRGAWYTMVEWLNEFTDAGAARSDVALGLLYEAPRWACEASVRLPLTEDSARETDFGVALGWRYLF